MKQNEWIVESYLDDDGNAPVDDWLDTLDHKTFARFEWTIEQVRVRNVQAHEPLVKKVSDKLWEMREESTTNIYRILYFFYTGRRIVLLHGFQKKTEKLPARELEIAEKRYTRFMEREQGAQGRH